jgi:phosphate transport system permease protein
MAAAPMPSSAFAAPQGGFLSTLRHILGIGSFADWLFKLTCNTSALLVILLVALIVLLLTLQAWPAIRTNGLRTVVDGNWNPEAQAPPPAPGDTKEYEPAALEFYKTVKLTDLDAEDIGYWGSLPAVLGVGIMAEKSVDAPREEPEFKFGGLPFIYGSIVTSILSMLLAVPLGVGTATFLAEIAPPILKRTGSFLVELLAAIPSVVYGFWGTIFLAPWIGGAFEKLGVSSGGGKSLLTASIILALMIVPYVAAVAYDVCQAVPRAQREGSLALGATRWQTIWQVVLPYARPGIIGGCFLALGRALGETMAVTMLIGNSPYLQGLITLKGGSPTLGAGNTIPSIIALQLPGANSDLWISSLVELGLLLFAVTIVMNMLARLLIWRVGKTRSQTPFWVRLLAGKKPAAVAAAPAAPPTSAPANRLQHIASSPPRREPLPSNAGRAGLMNHLMTGVLGLCLVLACIPLFLILGYIVFRGVGSLSFAFFVEDPAPYNPTLALGPDNHPGGLRNALIGSGLIVGLATLFAIPLGLLAAIYLAEYRSNWVAPTVRFFGELLNGVPSIVVGTFVYALVRLLIQWGWLPAGHQFSAFAGAFALAIMMIPIVMRASEEALKLVPQTLRNASHALGAHHWQTVVRVSVPAALPAIITGAFLAIARIAGETAPLLLTAFGNENVNTNPAEPTAFLPLYIYRWGMSGDEKVQVPMAWAAALVLLAFIMLLNVGIRVATGKRVILASQAD